MSNLLPPQSQKHLRIEYRARFLLVAAFVVLGCAALALLALVPAEIAVINLPTPTATSTASSTGADDRTALSQAQAFLKILGPIAAVPSGNPIAALLSERGGGIAIRAISYSVATKAIVVQGTADTPDHLNAFRAALQADTHFSDVSVPVSALIGSQDGGFTMSMKVQS